jgi:hypothetical protein
MANSEYAQDYINITWIPWHNQTFHFISIQDRYIDIIIIQAYIDSIISILS